MSTSVCPHCGFAENPSGSTVCRCGEPRAGGAPTGAPDETSDETSDKSVAASSESKDVTQAPKAASPAAQRQTKEDSVTGSVAWIDTRMENVPFDFYRFLSKGIIFLLLLPVLFSLFAFLAAVAISFAILGFKEMARGTNPFNPANSINAVGVFFGIFRGPGREQESVRSMSLDDGGEPRVVLLRGDLRKGVVVQGDMVTFFGQLKEGSLLASRGINHTHGDAVISLPLNPWKYAFYPLLALLVGVTVYVVREMR